MDAILNFDYDGESDYLYASFGAPKHTVGVDVSGTPVVIMVGHDGRMAGFDIALFRQLSPHRVPMLAGRVPTSQLSVPADTPWLQIEYAGADVRICLEQAPEQVITLPGFAAGARPPDGLTVDLAPLFAGHQTY